MAVIPEQLPVILKDFSKAVLVEQPEDIFEFAASYFTMMAKNSAPAVHSTPAKGKLSAELLRRLRSLLQELPSGNISPSDFVNACRKLKVHQNVIDQLLSLSDDELVPWEQVLVQSTSLTHDKFLEAMKTVFEVFSETNGSISCSNLLSLFHFLSSSTKMSPQVSEEVGNSISEWLLNRSMDVETENLTWKEFASSPLIIEQFRS
jgi:hypothetical protein